MRSRNHSIDLRDHAAGGVVSGRGQEAFHFIQLAGAQAGRVHWILRSVPQPGRQDIEAKPQVRNSLTRIEVDTIRFGFNEAFVREEEVDSLDQIASVIERVLKKYPREVFLIEGHTDAVGSDVYNGKLSKGRAEAVKKALTSFYVIPAKNLKTVGLGERYLKIPTADAEQENRRVSISRATALIGEVDE